MLNKTRQRSLFFASYILLSLLQCYAAYTNQLFVDEAFYWLEGSWLAWSYSEIPGWTPWTLALSNWLFPQQEFFVRLPSLMAAFAIPWVGMAIHQQLFRSEAWSTGLLLLALPVLGLIGIMAIPDVWIILFTSVAVLYLIVAIKSSRPVFFLLLGVTLALGINTHLRYWLIVILAGAIITWQFRQNHQVLKKIYGITLPVVLIGFIPVMLFNFQHDFPLLSFQLKDRHPWAFQAGHMTFFLAQVLLTTPWVFYLCITALKTAPDQVHNRLIKFVIYLAVIHWLVYALVGFYSDTLRINVHWTLVSYVLLIAIYSNSDVRLKSWASITGVSANVSLLLLLVYWLHWQSPPSQLNSQISNNATGWQQLAKTTDTLIRSQRFDQLVTDNFMTLAQHQFYSRQTVKLKTLEHPLNLKHGRAKQLELMGLMQNETAETTLLVVEHTALKLAQQIPFYQAACELLHGIQLIDTLNHADGMKTFLFFKTGGGQCQLPPIYYLEQQGSSINGWVLNNKDLESITVQKTVLQRSVDKMYSTDIGNNQLFSTLPTQQHQLTHFVIDDAGTEPFQLKFVYPETVVYSKRLYP